MVSHDRPSTLGVTTEGTMRSGSKIGGRKLNAGRIYFCVSDTLVDALKQRLSISFVAVWKRDEPMIHSGEQLDSARECAARVTAVADCKTSV